MTIQIIKEEVQNWDKTQQADLMHFLVELLSNDKFQIPTGWKEELDKRENAYRNGTSVGRPAREVLAEYLSK